MAIVISNELKDSRTWMETPTEKMMERVFNITGTDDPALASPFGPQIGEFWDDELRVVERNLKVVMPAGSGPDDGVMEMRVVYRWRYIHSPGAPPEFELDIGTESEHVFVTPRKATIDGVVFPALDQGHYGLAILKEEPKNFINVNKDHVAEGIDVLMPRIQLREEHERASLPIAYQRTLVRLTGKVNSVAWRGWPAKAVLFLGTVARKRKGENWHLSYSFLAGYHAAVELTGVYGAMSFTKHAHDYLWFRRTEEESGGTTVNSEVLDAHVAPLYHVADFAALGIGTEVIL